jgi:flagellar basal-body rod protein FlgB
MFPMNNSSFKMLESSLQAAALRQKVVANNIANVDTPHYKRSDVKFEEYLQKELGQQPSLVGYRTHPLHFHIGGQQAGSGQVAPQVMTDERSIMNNNQNNVDIDYEMSLMAKNQLRYNVMVQQVNNELKKVRSVLGGR